MKRAKRILVCIIPVLLCISIAIPNVVAAEWNPETAVHIDPKSIENSTIAFGTHLIHVSAVSEKLYELALQSATESSQSIVYYKSELAEGSWFNITVANNLDDIAVDGSPVDEGRIEALFFTHHTKSDGITYDLRTNQEVNIYDLPFLYDVYDIEELMPLIEQYEYMNTVSTYINAKDTVKKFLEGTKTIPTTHSLTTYDKQINSLTVYQNSLREKKVIKERLDIVERGLEHLNATRRSKFLEVIEPQLTSLGEEIKSKKDVSGKGPEKLIPSIDESKTNVQNSIAKWKLKMLLTDGLVLNTYRYNFYDDLIMAVDSGADAGTTDPMLENLLNLKRIEDKEIKNLEAELAMLQNELTPAATGIYIQKFSAGESSDFTEAVKREATIAEQSQIIMPKMYELKSIQTELEFFIEGLVERMDKTPALEFLDVRIAEAEKYYDLVPKDEFANGADSSIESHIEFLRRLRNKVLGETTEEDELDTEEDELEEELDKAIKDNKLDEANSVKDKIDDLNNRRDRLDENKNTDLGNKIKDLEDKLQDADGDTADKIKDELDDAYKNLEGGGASDGQYAGGLKEEGLDAIDRGDKPTIDEVLDKLIDLSDSKPDLADKVILILKDAMEERRDVLGDKSLNDQIDKAIEALEDANLLPPINMDAIKDLFMNYDPTQHKRNAAIANALGEVAEKYNMVELDRYSVQWVEMIYKDKNPYTYTRINNSGNEYIPCDVLCYHTNMRYVWQQSQLTGTMSKHGNYYSFTMNSTNVSRDKDGKKTEQLPIAAKWQDTLHIHEDYTTIQFDAEAYYVPKTKRGVMISTEIKLIKADILKLLEGVS